MLAAADKVDSLTVAFALGERPTGSRDPFGLRRAAIGLCRLAVEAGLEIDVAALVARDLALLTGQSAEVKDDPTDVWDFVLERLEGLLDVPVEFVRAARASALRELGAVARLATHARRPRATRRSSPVPTPRTTARTGSPAGRTGAAPALDPRLATEPAEDALVEALAAAGPQIEAAVAAGDFGTALAAAAELAPPVDRVLRRGARDGRGLRRSARTACGSYWTSATRSAGWATCRRSRASVPAMSDPVELHVVSDSTGETAAKMAKRRRGPVPGSRVRRRSGTRGS